MRVYVLAKDVSPVSVRFLIVICMIFGIEDWVWPQHPQLLPRAAIRLEYVVPRVGRQSRGELPSGAERIWVETRAAAQVSPRKWLMSLAQFLLNVKSTFMSCWQERMPETLPSLLTVGSLLMLFLTS